VSAGIPGFMHPSSRPLLRIGEALATIAVAVCAGYGLGELFIWLWAPTPTPDNSSPPPEAFLFLWGALIGFFAVLLARVLLVPLWLRRRRKFG
jgi:hypothetical protein